MISAPSSNGHRPTAVWRTTTVQAFFTQIPWEGAPQGSPLGQPGADAASAPMLQQTVGQFFQHFPWEGTPEIAAPMIPLSVQSPPANTNENLTLDDFSSLF